tara:strand:- start:487 stop:861 length:375 start_codon:yes stop_codon:yes gene_type:complete
MPAQWSEDDLVRELTKYSELKAQSDLITEQIKDLGERLRQHYYCNDLKTFTIGSQRFECAARKKPVYSRRAEREIARLNASIKAMKKLEEENFFNEDYTGPDQCQSIEQVTHHHMVIRQIEEGE